jgi:hypothetical protein
VISSFGDATAQRGGGTAVPRNARLKKDLGRRMMQIVRRHDGNSIYSIGAFRFFARRFHKAGIRTRNVRAPWCLLGFVADQN